jgi:hypothetical protein
MTKRMNKVAPVMGNYASPEVTVVEIAAEGVLCQSGQFEEWQEETLDW